MIILTSMKFTRELLKQHPDVYFVFEECFENSHGYTRITDTTNPMLSLYLNKYRPSVGQYAIRGMDNALPLTLKESANIDGYFINSHESTERFVECLKKDINRINLIVASGKHVVFPLKGFCDHRCGLSKENAETALEFIISTGINVTISSNKHHELTYGILPTRDNAIINDLSNV